VDHHDRYERGRPRPHCDDHRRVGNARWRGWHLLEARLARECPLGSVVS
jgi:hypothetical protein